MAQQERKEHKAKFQHEESMAAHATTHRELGEVKADVKCIKSFLIPDAASSSSVDIRTAADVKYAAAKSGIHGFTKALAQEGAAKGITVNAIAPGYIATDMVRAVPENVLEKIVQRIPVGRLGEAHEIARGVLFLVSDDAGFITGSTMSINGGQHMY